MMRLRRLTVAPFEAAAALAAIIIGTLGVLEPAATGSVEAVVPTLARSWSAGYAVAGILVLVGLTSGRRAVEVVGLMMLAAGVTVQSITAGMILGPQAVLALPPRIGFAVAALVRVWVIVAGREIVTVDARTLR